MTKGPIQNLPYADLLDNAPVIIAVHDLDNNIVWANKAYQNATEFSLHEIEGKKCYSVWRLSHPCRNCPVATVIETGEPAEAELTPQNQEHWPDSQGSWLSKAAPIRDEGGNIIGAIEIAHDITERKRAEDALRKSEEDLRLTLDATTDGIWEWNFITNELYFSPRYYAMLGYEPDEFPSSYEIWQNLIHPDDLQSALGVAEEYLKTKPDKYESEFRLRTKSGDYRWVRTCAKVVERNEKGEAVRMIGNHEDITERKQAEEALRRSQSMLARTERIAGIGSWEWDIATDSVTWSEELFRFFQQDPDDGALSWADHSKLYHPEDFEALRQAVERAVSDGEPYELELRALRKDGKTRMCLARGLAEMGFDGRAVRLFGSLQDITDRKQAEEEKERLQVQLREARKMEAIGTLSGGIAHDYNNLLAAIMGNLSMAREEAEPHSAMAELLHEIEQASYKARDLTHQFLTLSEGGHPRKERGSIESLLKEILGQVQRHEGIEDVFSIQDDLWPVEYDSKQMQYVISNVLMNAMEAMPQGGTVTIQAENKVIENKDKEFPSFFKEGKYVRISIKDEGRGISEEHMEKVFDPYFSTKARGVQKGMGLGLTTAYAVAEKHGGHITLSSATGVGTTINIYLPAAEEIEKEKSTRQKSDDITPSISGVQSTIKRILVMDDEESLRTLAQRMLERLGYEVETVKDGAEAIETYKKHMDSGEPFDGVILDLTIKGGMGGAQAIKELIKIDPDVKAIVCSGYFNDPVLTKHEEYGFRGAMAKPYQKADLEQVLKKILG